MLPPKDPLKLFTRWFHAAAKRKSIMHPNAACLSTLSPSGFPEGRIVLLKEFSEDGFVFYTNLLSLKGRSLRRLPRASLTFYWEDFEHQVRLQGTTHSVPPREADAYFHSRPRAYQLGAWASAQSQVLPSRSVLENRYRLFERKFRGKEVPRPPHWGGVLLRPRRMEFWIGRPRRLHDRFLYIKKSRADWKLTRLYP